MKRKHSPGDSPGCYCCGIETPPPCEDDFCCGEEEVFPTITATTGASPDWIKRYQSTSEECCCTTALFDWNGDEPVADCCEELGFYSYRHEALRTDWVWKLPPGLVDRVTGCGTTDCGDEECCLGQPEKLAEWLFYWQDRFNYFFRVKLFYTELEVTYGRQLIECTETDEEPVCRYYIQSILRYRAEAYVSSQRINSTGRSLEYLHPCYEYTGPALDYEPCDGDCTINENTKHSIATDGCDTPGPLDFGGLTYANFQCEYDSECTSCEEPCEDCEPGSDCESLLPNDNAPENCFSNEIAFCVKRIRFFDEPPALGDYFLGDDDTPKDNCDLPNCGSLCLDNNEIAGLIIVQSGDNPDPPFWYTDPPVVTVESTTYVADFSLCTDPIPSAFLNNFTASGFSSCCEEGLPIASPCNAVACTSPSTFTFTCASVNDSPYSNWQADDEKCRLTTWYLTGDQFSGPNDITGGCGTFGGTGVSTFAFFNVPCCSPPTFSGFSNFPCIRLKCETTNPCGDADCCYQYECGGCFCKCIPLYPFLGGYADLTSYDITTDGSWTPQQCEFNVPEIKVTLS